MNTRRLLLLLLCCMPFLAWSEPTIIAVWNADGTQNSSFALSDEPIVSFPSGKMIITVKGTDTSFEFSKISKLTYTSPTGISGVKDESGKPFEMTGNTLLFPAGNKDAKVFIVSANGMLVTEKTVKAGETLSIPLSKFAIGVYAVKVNDTTYKIVKK